MSSSPRPAEVPVVATVTAAESKYDTLERLIAEGCAAVEAGEAVDEPLTANSAKRLVRGAVADLIDSLVGLSEVCRTWG